MEELGPYPDTRVMELMEELIELMEELLELMEELDLVFTG